MLLPRDLPKLHLASFPAIAARFATYRSCCAIRPSRNAVRCDKKSERIGLSDYASNTGFIGYVSLFNKFFQGLRLHNEGLLLRPKKMPRGANS